VTEYADSEGNVLALRDQLSPGTMRKIADLEARPAASANDRWQRREELLFEHLAVTWTIAGLPLTGQRELLGRYRIADSETRSWVRRTIHEHLGEKQPDALM
jgi:hypothetical protein